MGYDAMANGASVSVPALISKDAAQKKKTNRSAKLKQCKLDVRREQWLSQVKSKDDCKILSVGASPTSPLANPPQSHDAKTRVREEDSIPHGNSDSDPPTPYPCVNRRSISSRSSIDSSSRSDSDAEEEETNQALGAGDNVILDDWEAVADALSEANDRGNRLIDPGAPAMSVHPVAASAGLRNEPPRSGGGTTKPEPIRSAPRAWRPDDASRPRSLPSISKQWSILGNTDRHCLPPQQKGILSLPCPCPICYEDLDPTDSSFFPCVCGFRLCLFCHKQILESDGRCPGCRKQYDSMSGGAPVMNTVGAPLLPLQVSRSFSMSSRSWNKEH